MKINVLHINYSDGGGAAKASLTLHQELLKKGITSNYLALNLTKEYLVNDYVYSHRRVYNSLFEKAYYLYYKARRINNKIEQLFKGLPKTPEISTFPISTFDITKDPLYKEADIIHLHFITQFVDFPSFFNSNKKPIIWTLHDRNPFSGVKHCNYNFPEKEFSNLEKQAVKIKINALNGQDVHVVSPSISYESASLSSEVLGGFPHSVINHGIDQTVYHPLDKSACREKLNLLKEDVIFLVVATDLENRSLKGFDKIVKLATNMQESNVLFYAVGNHNEKNKLPKNIKLAGVIDSPDQLNCIYNACDYHLSASLEESFGLTVAESIAAGTPVICYNVGGLKDIVKHNENGVLVEFNNFEELQKTVINYAKEKVCFNRESIKKDAVNRFDLSTQTEKYIKLYKKVLKNKISL